jgi:hypothetical protein
MSGLQVMPYSSASTGPLSIEGLLSFRRGGTIPSHDGSSLRPSFRESRCEWRWGGGSPEAMTWTGTHTQSYPAHPMRAARRRKRMVAFQVSVEMPEDGSQRPPCTPLMLRSASPMVRAF